MEAHEELARKLVDVVVAKAMVIVNDGQFTQGDLEPLLMAIIETVQVFNTTHKMSLTGVQKRDLALATAEHVLKVLHDKKFIDDETMQRAMAAVRFAGPALMDGLKALYKKMYELHDDIERNGCAGCCRRNF